MRGVSKHIAPDWRADLVEGLQRLWNESLAERAKFLTTVGCVAVGQPASGSDWTLEREISPEIKLVG